MPESETIEHKKSLAELKDGIISIAAILNKHRHGELWFGVRNDGTADGVTANEKTLRDLSQSIEDVPEISSEAMREAIINAFCHRDYRDLDYVPIAVFKNRVEIRSPGGLYDDMIIEKMLHGNVSKRRNPLIANLLRRIQMVEAWGRGMPLILKNAPNVTFREISNIFIASFDRPSFVEEEEMVDNGTDTTEANTNETIKETIKEKPKTTKEIILDAIKEKPTISVKELVELCGLTAPGIQYHINNLKKAGFIRHVGATKTGYWETLV